MHLREAGFARNQNPYSGLGPSQREEQPKLWAERTCDQVRTVSGLPVGSLC